MTWPLLSRPAAVRLLGLIGSLGGLVLLAAFVVEIPQGWNQARLVLFLAGATAIAVAMHPAHASIAPPTEAVR